jgi:translocation and assembly module TamB
MRKRIFIAALLLLLLAPIVLVVVLLYTETGVGLLAQQLPRLERIGVRIEGVSGTLAGPLRVTRFELDHPRVHVVVHDIIIEPQLRALFIQTLQTRSVTAHDALVEIRAADMPPSDHAPRFLPRFLRIDARGLDLAGVRYVHLNGTTVEAERVRGHVTITARRLRVHSFQVNAHDFDAAGSLGLLADTPLGIQASAAGHLRLPRAELALRAELDGTLDRLAIRATLQRPSQASVDALFTRPEDRWRLEGTVNSAAFALDPFMDKPPLSLRNVALDVVANAEEIRAIGDVGIPQLSEKDLTIDARGRFADRVLHLASVDAALNDTPAKAHVAGTIAFTGGTPTLDLAARWRSLQWPLTQEAVVASAIGEGTLRGASPYEFTVNAQVVGPRIPAAQGAASGTLHKEQLTIASYQINALDGALSGAASLQFTQPRAWTLAVKGANIDPRALHAEFPGRLNLTAKADGVGLDRKARFNLSVDALSGVLRGKRVHGAGRVQRDRKSWTAHDLKVGFGNARLMLDGHLSETVDLRWSLQAPSLADLLPDAAGSLQSSGTARGSRRAPHIIADVAGKDLRYQGWRAGGLALDADLDAANAKPSKLLVQAHDVGRNEPLIGELRVNGEGVATDHRIDVAITGFAATPGEAPPRAVLKTAGSYDKERWVATITTTELTRGDGPDNKFEIVEPARVVASQREALLEHLCLVVSKGRVCAQGQWRRNGPWEGVVSGYEIPLAFLLPPAGEAAEYAGRIEGRVRAHGQPGKPWQADAGMRIIDAAIIHRPPGAEPQTLNLGTGGLAATATPERITFSFGVQAFTDTFLYANAQLLRDGGGDIMNLPLTGDLRARAADANILPLLFADVDKAAGLLTANATVAGSLAAPRIEGRIELANGEFDSYRLNLALRELNVRADLSNDGLDFRGAGRAGDGRLDLDGRYSWRGGKSRGDLHLQGQNLLVADLPEYRVVASPDLRFRVDGQRIDVAGDVVIPSALLQPNQITGAVRASDDARYVGEHSAEREGKFIVHSEVRITMGEDVRVEAFGLQGQITGGVGLTMHTGDTPVGRGALGVAVGRYEAYGQKLEITRGQLLFDASPLDDPGLDIEARREIETTTVGVNVRGTLQEPRVTFFSDPAMSQTQIVSYLLTGKSVDTMQSGMTSTTRSTQDALAVQGGGLLASQLGRRLGLDEVGVESSTGTAGESNSSLVLGKFLSPRLFISYGISLTESINTLKLRYMMSERWTFKTESGEHQSADVEYTIEK